MAGRMRASFVQHRSHDQAAAGLLPSNLGPARRDSSAEAGGWRRDKSTFTDGQIVATPKLAERSSVDEVCQKMGISRNDFYAWRKKYGGWT